MVPFGGEATVGGMLGGLIRISGPIDDFEPRSRRGWTSLYARSLISGLRHRSDFSTVERYCFFLGYARSGHSIVATLLNAHPEMVVSNELHALRFVQRGFRRDQIFALILALDKSFGESGRKWTGYDYIVPDEYQGSFTRLRVIGDKKGGATSRAFADRPGLLRKLRETIKVPIRVVHVTRNPFDNIARMSKTGTADLGGMLVRYSGLCDSVSRVRDELTSEELFDTRHEDFSRCPESVLESICGFLGVSASAKYLADCASIVNEPTTRARDTVSWTKDQIASVNRLIDRYPFLDGYSFDT